MGRSRRTRCDKIYQSWLLIPLLIVLRAGLFFFAVRALWSLRSNKALVARLGEFVTLPAEERADARRREVDALLAAVGDRKQRKRNWRWMDGVLGGRRHRADRPRSAEDGLDVR